MSGRIRFGILAGLTLSVMTSTIALAADPSEAALYAAAQSEPGLVWYQVPLSQGLGARLADAFVKKFPGLKVASQRGPAGVLFQKVEQETQSGSSGADIYTASLDSQLAMLKKQNQLLAYLPPNEASVVDMPGIKNVDPDGYFYGTFVYAVGIAYNTKQLTRDTAPKSYAELTDPKWASKISVPNPAASGTFGIVAVQLAKMYGTGFFQKLADNHTMVLSSLPDVISSVEAGESAAGIAPLSFALDGKKRGQTIDVIYPSDGTLPAISVSGILKKTKSPNAAKLFLNFLLSRDASQIVSAEFNEPLYSSVATPPDLTPLSQLKIVLPSDAEIGQKLPSVISAWRDAFGM